MQRNGVQGHLMNRESVGNFALRQAVWAAFGALVHQLMGEAYFKNRFWEGHGFSRADYSGAFVAALAAEGQC